ncbi:glycosyltransferase family 4 protein [Butyrivibrio sp. WCD2001]|uniref:glycosyltransferase family 4 protein n=1 Tax=Butyrivibrio sp. WCD2001 TaxID=1280681 RepID=UPI000413919C|nr:glycosyltransferase family 4 protein [Butyrivibrio sp. WCD2001]
MKVLWVCNIMLPAFAKAKGLAWSDREGWLSGAYDKILMGKENCNITLGVAFPAEDMGRDAVKIENVSFYGFSENLNAPEIYDEKLEDRFKEIYESFQPDLIHVFGTEFPHSLAAIRAFGKPERTLLGIQGLCSEIEKVYMANLPESVCNDMTFRDKYKNDSLLQQKEKFAKRAENEIEAIKLTGHITGRTGFDKETTSKINPTAKYHKMNETMRPTFYKDAWRAVNTVPHSIFLSQGDYPLKGFHFVLEAVPEILKEFPDTKIYVAGNSVIGKIKRKTVTIPDEQKNSSGKSKYPMAIRISAYGKYLKRLIRRGRLGGKVVMLGKLSAEQMKEQLLKCNLFICPSILENSPNSMAEAMLLGVPVVAADTGGIPDMLEKNVDGLLFEAGNPEDLAKCIRQMFREPVIAAVYGDNARKHAMITHDPAANFKRLVEIYKEICLPLEG